MERPSSARVGTVLALVALVPVVIGGVAGQPDKAETPKPVEAKLTVDFTADEALGDGGGSTRHLVLSAAGPQPANSTQLVDRHGRNVTTLTPVEQTRCSGDTTQRSTGLTDAGAATLWCLEVAGLRAGSEVTGLVETQESKVTLTLALRHRWLFGPMLAAFLGFAVGVSSLSVVPFVLAITRRSEIDGLLDDNENAPPPRRIGGLRDWVKRQKETKAQSDSTLLPFVDRLIRFGPDVARSARLELRTALAASTLPADQPVRLVAVLEASRNSHETKDFLDEEGEVVQHPAAARKKELDRVQEIETHLDFATERVERIKPNAAPELLQELAALHRFFARAVIDDLERIEAKLEAFHEMLDGVTDARAVAAGAGKPVVVVEEWSLPNVSRGGALVLRGTVIVGGGLLALLALNFSVYDPANAFGRAGDYYKLAAAAAGSGVVASIAPLLSWRSWPTDSK